MSDHTLSILDALGKTRRTDEPNVVSLLGQILEHVASIDAQLAAIVPATAADRPPSLAWTPAIPATVDPAKRYRDAAAMLSEAEREMYLAAAVGRLTAPSFHALEQLPAEQRRLREDELVGEEVLMHRSHA